MYSIIIIYNLKLFIVYITILDTFFSASLKFSKSKSSTESESTDNVDDDGYFKRSVYCYILC